MVQRKLYMDKLIKLQDEKIIKVITGIRRSGKSTLLNMFQEHLKRSGVADNRIISINFEDLQYGELLDYHKLHDYIIKRLVKGSKTYVFLDEIQSVHEFQRTVDSLYIKDDVDIYITGSNAYLLSGELATLLTGRYIEINILPLSFAEYYELKGGDKRDAFASYYRDGSFPQAAQIADDAVRADYIRSIYNTVLLKDIVARKKINDVELLESVTRFLFDNIGNIVSSNRIADSLTSYGRKTNPITVENYVTALIDSYVLYKASRYDVKGKHHLKSLEKYYLADVGLRHLLLGGQGRDVGRVLENIAYLELIRRGYTVRIGKVGGREVDFVATIGDKREYYQVAASILDLQTYEREMASLLSINDHFPKYVLTMDELPDGQDGIQALNIIDWLLAGDRQVPRPLVGGVLN